MVQVNNQTQLSTFETLRTIIKSNSTLTSKFDNNNIYNFDPADINNKLDLLFPYIYISIPSINIQDRTLGNTSFDKEFAINIKLILEWQARDKMITYYNALIYELEKAVNQSTLSSLGYDDLKIKSETPISEIIHENPVISATITIELGGEVIV